MLISKKKFRLSPYIRLLTLFSSILSPLACIKSSQERPSSASQITEDIAILGDSLSSGAATHPDMEYDYNFFWQLVAGEKTLKADASLPIWAHYVQEPAQLTLKDPVFLARSSRELNSHLNWVSQHFVDALSHNFLDTPIYSWGYFMAQKLGIPASQTYIAAHHGAKIEHLSRQIDRVLDHNGGTMAKHNFIFFTGNDLCAQDMNAITSSLDYAASLKRGLRYLVLNSSVSSKPISVYVLSFLPVSQILTKDSILKQKIKAHGESVSCTDLRMRAFQADPKAKPQELHPEAAYLRQLVPANPAHFCPTLFSQHALAERELGIFSSFDQDSAQSKLVKIQEDMISLVASRIRAYQVETKRVLDEVQLWAKEKHADRNIDFQFISHSSDIEFEGSDMAADCFHLNVYGQDKIAQAVWLGMQARAQKS